MRRDIRCREAFLRSLESLAEMPTTRGNEVGLLVDDDVSCIGTVNCDNRSFRLNFEVSLVTVDESFAAETEVMLEQDLARCREISLDELEKLSLPKRVAVNLARLWAPLL